MTDKILIANRGEIACRIIKTAKKMGICTVAVYSDADTTAKHKTEADQSVYIGESPARQSYLDTKKILDAIKKTGATMVHPGYGFLSENADFVRQLDKIGVKFIGPSAASVAAMGDKIESKKIAIKAGVNTVPGFMGEVADAQEAMKIASDIGYPVMIKAAAGGGGKGMRVVANSDEMTDAFLSATGEARNSFGDDRIFVEKFIEQPRHIEIQVIADQHGNVVCLGERECSIQRNHQKVIEESPSPFLDETTRTKMYEQSVALVKEVGYYSAGTIEYIVDQKRNFYFLEMNTRLQVEHPVTELVTGLDIVELMIRIARGEKLGFAQDDIKINGWAIEARVYAEDPKRGFLPSSGRISTYREPEEVEGVRIDTGVYEGAEVSMFYDAMISKLCTFAQTRDEAIIRMQRALANFMICGVTHNITFLEEIMQNERFKSGDISTNFIKEEYPGGFSGSKVTDVTTKILVAVASFINIKNLNRQLSITDTKITPSNRWIVEAGGDSYCVELSASLGGYYMNIDGENIIVESDWHLGSKLVRARINNVEYSVKIKKNSLTGSYILMYAGGELFIRVLDPRIHELCTFIPKKNLFTKPTNLVAPISGRVVRFKVADGEEIKAGGELMIIEAMKMENVIRTDYDVVIKKICVQENDNVASGDVLIEFGG